MREAGGVQFPNVAISPRQLKTSLIIRVISERAGSSANGHAIIIRASATKNTKDPALQHALQLFRGIFRAVPPFYSATAATFLREK